MIDLKIGGVPEHFNYPWYLALKDKAFQKENINLRWQDFPGGTGEMCEALRNKTVDIAIILTEGIIKDIANGNPSKIIQVYVESPLVWGIHIHPSSSFKKIDELQHQKIAISRFGSGSHLMAIVNANRQKWDAKHLEFVEVQNLEGGIEAIQNKTAGYFMWEKFTTKPYVDAGIFKRIGNCPTPWPCFVIAVRDEILEKHPYAIKKVVAIINSYTSDFKKTPNIDAILAKRYHQKQEDIQQWLKITRWNSTKHITKNLITRIQNKMMSYNVIKEKKDAGFFIKKL